MSEEIYQILANAGSAGIVGLMFIAYLYFDSKKKNSNLKSDNKADSTQNTDIALIKQKDIQQDKDIEELRKNHLAHQERIERALIKIAVKLRIEKIFD